MLLRVNTWCMCCVQPAHAAVLPTLNQACCTQLCPHGHKNAPCAPMQLIDRVKLRKGSQTHPPPTEFDTLIDSYSFRRYSCTSTSNFHKVTSLSHVASLAAIPFHCTKKSMRQFLRLAPMVLWLRIFSTFWLNYFITTDIACFSYTLSLSKSS